MKNKHIRMALDRKLDGLQTRRKARGLAFDKKSQRSVDADGRLHIALTRISKANVCPYQGSEIPDAEELGLDEDKIYYLYRDPQELEKGAASFNNLPVLSMHVPVSADEPMKELIVGSTGTDATMAGQYLVNSMVVWDTVAIRGIEAEVQREISSAYRYRADMTPGVVNGEKYDGVMRDIVGNHVALVETGRVGPDVFAADRQPIFHTERSSMKLSRKALTVRGALFAYLRPKLAQDSAIKSIEALNPLVKGITATNVASESTRVARAIEGKFKSKLAADADLEDLKALIDAFADKNDGETALDEDDDGDDAMDGQGDPDPENTNVLDFLKGKLSDEDHSAVVKMFSTKDAKDAIPNDPDDDDDDKKPKPIINRAQDDDDTDPIKAPNTAKIGKKAMDAAIRLAQDKVVERMNAIRVAEKAVAPHIGEVALQETPEAVYKLALDAAKVSTKGVHPSAYAAMVSMLPPPGAKPTGEARLAQDGALVTNFLADYPGAKIPARA